MTEELTFSVIETSVVTEVMQELEKAMTKHPTGMRSIHEGYAVILEEVDELWDEIKVNKPCGACIRKEAIQVAAMALRFLIDLNPGSVPYEEPKDELTLAAEALSKVDGVPVETLLAAMRTALATNEPQYVARPDGTRRVLLPTDTNRFKVVAEPEMNPASEPTGSTGIEEPVRLPDAHALDELRHIATLNDALGG